MAASLLHVRYKNHSEGLAEVWRNFLRNNFLVDCTLAADGQYIKAHRLILSACSPYFEMLFSEEREKHPFVVLSGASFDTLKAVVDFVYNGEAELPAENVKIFLSLAKSLQIKGLTNSTESDRNENSCPNAIGNSPPCVSNENQGTCEVTPQQDLQTFPVKSEPLYFEFEETNIVLKTDESDEHLSENIMNNLHEGTAVIDEQDFSEWEQFEQNYSGCRPVESQPAVLQPQEKQQQCQQHHQEQQVNDLPCEASSGPDVGKKHDFGMCLRLNIEKMDGSESEESVPTKDVPEDDKSKTNEGVKFGGQNLNPSSSADEAVAVEPERRLRRLKQTRTVPHVQLPRTSRRGGSSLAHRKKRQVGQRPHTCDICGVTFRWYTTLKYHKFTHTGERPFKCDVCGVSFAQPNNLKTHQRKHTGERPFMCHVCGVSFSRSGNLKTHQRKHTGERRFSCDVCDSSFLWKHHLQSHLRTHTGERPFCCNVCGVSFTQVYNLKSHQRTHTGERPFTCDVCGASFTHLSNLKTHHRTHTGERPFSCDVCDCSFTRKNHLILHLRTHTATGRSASTSAVSLSHGRAT